MIYDRYVAEGKIKEVGFIEPVELSGRYGPRVEVKRQFTEFLSKLPADKKVGAAWALYDEFGKGLMDALLEGNYSDIKLFTVDVSNDDLKLMREYPQIRQATAAVDPVLIGRGSVRIQASKFAGEKYFEKYIYTAQLVPSSQLAADSAMPDLPRLVIVSQL